MLRPNFKARRCHAVHNDHNCNPEEEEEEEHTRPRDTMIMAPHVNEQVERPRTYEIIITPTNEEEQQQQEEASVRL